MKKSDELRKIARDIAARLQAGLPQAPDNEWFTPRVINRLPEKRHNRVAILVQWLCYLLSLGALGTGTWLTVDYILANGLTAGSLVILASIPVLAIFCTIVMAAPAVRKAFEGEQGLFR